MYQVRIQCLRCGDHLSSALSQAAHVGWRDYPETDPAIAARFQAPSNIGPTLAVEASKILERDLTARVHSMRARRSERSPRTGRRLTVASSNQQFLPAGGWSLDAEMSAIPPNNIRHMPIRFKVGQ